MEYSITKDAAFCLCCYLFKPIISGSDSFISEGLQNGEISSGRGLNQHTSLKRFGDTRWGSHYGTLISLIFMFSSITEVLEIIVDDKSNFEQRCEANFLLEFMQSFDFIFSLHLMRNILGVIINYQ